MADLLTLADFTPLVGSSFRLLDVEGVTLVLTEAKPLATMKKGAGSSAPGGRDPFDLLFLGAASPILPQGIYRMEAEGLNSLEIFIVAIGPRDDGMGYQAIFT